MVTIQNKTIRRFYLFISSIFIFLLHLPFVFAKSKPHTGALNAGEVAKKEIQLIDTMLTGCISKLTTVQKDLYDSLRLHTLGLTREVFDLTMRGFNRLKAAGKIVNDNVLSIADFSQPSGNKRLYIIDVKNYRVLFNTWVAHGSRSGEVYATEFSNTPSSNKSSLGFYTTADTYMGRHGYSLHLQGQERGFNDNAYNRDIVVHGADYVSPAYADAQGRIGRSWGCPAVPPELNNRIIEKIKNGSCLFIYSPNQRYLNSSDLVKN
jgi:L,D-transpeptidase catalytic domain